MKKYTIVNTGHHMWSVTVSTHNPILGAWIETTILFTSRASAREYVKWVKSP